MFKQIMRIAAAALVAGAIAFAITVAPAAKDHEAKQGPEATQALPFAKADRLRVRSRGPHARCTAGRLSSRNVNSTRGSPPAKRAPFGSSPFARCCYFPAGTRPSLLGRELIDAQPMAYVSIAPYPGDTVS